ncbi:T9SS type A sorting domain-containing protein [Parvicella tangerina]|uniref:Secretion system C-terminal sorting domain-containing protein n=1 Tax=Parvicella tangerina TaxID=2829795 RepID=A0A916JN64_9FLAO|nr:T9SS type A sorting domain-containing protein [Parvicella tangerina]CAG5084127.1 hypothetical protein CRYO30217_02383 [Parvicella tangerina]
MKRLYTLLIGSALAGSLLGQTFDVGGPVTNHTKYSFSDVKDMEVMPSFDLDAVIAANEANAANKIGPYMFGYEHAVNYNLNNSGEWQTLDNGDKVWRIRIASPGALSLNFVFSDFKLPKGAHLHIYNADRSMVVGAYTHENNNPNDELGTELIKGDDATIEYYVPKSAASVGRLQLTMVVHGYNDIMGWYSEKALNDSGGCNMDAICPDGDDWRNEIRSVARIVNGGGVCSGTLLNDVPQSGTPYFLTANHCSPQSMGSYVFQFHYDSPTCGSQTTSNSTAPSASDVKSINGSVLRARNADSDFGLVELNSTPPASYNVYYAGWNNSGNTPQTAVGIHHPSGDVKKISFDDDPLQSASGLSSVANSEWRIEQWERNTTTEGGSSGSGLWDENHLIIGQLHGGQAACGNSVNDYYGKFSMSWDGNGSSQASERLQDWLDPQNTGATTMPGWDPNQPTVDYDAGITNNVVTGTLCSSVYEPEIILKNTGVVTLTSCTITYDVDGGTSNTYNWTGSLATNASEVVVLGSISVSGSGSHTFNATVSNPNGNADENSVNDAIVESFNAIPNSMPVYLNLLVDCYGEEVAWELTEQGSTTVLFSGNNYPGTGTSPVATGTQVTEEMCLSNGCYTFEITDDYGDGMSGAQYGGCDTDGDYNLEDYYGNQFFTMAQADYGTGTSHDFCITSVGVDENNLATMVNVFPNPAEDNFSILLGNSDLKIASVNIVDVRGAVVMNLSKTQTTTQTNVDVSNLSKGVYFVNITTDQGVVTKKLALR